MLNALKSAFCECPNIGTTLLPNVYFGHDTINNNTHPNTSIGRSVRTLTICKNLVFMTATYQIFIRGQLSSVYPVDGDLLSSAK